MSKRKKITPLQRATVFRDHAGVCHICTRKIAPGEAWEVEHPKALGLGGEDNPSNWRPAHRDGDCHKGKTRKDKAIMSKADRQLKKWSGVSKPKRKIPSRPFNTWRPE